MGKGCLELYSMRGPPSGFLFSFVQLGFNYVFVLLCSNFFNQKEDFAV